MNKRTESEGITAEMEENTLPGSKRKSSFIAGQSTLKVDSVLVEKKKMKKGTQVLCHCIQIM